MKIEYLGIIGTLITVLSFLIGRITALKKDTEEEVSCKINQKRDIKELQDTLARFEFMVKDLFAQCAKEVEIAQINSRLDKLEGR